LHESTVITIVGINAMENNESPLPWVSRKTRDVSESAIRLPVIDVEQKTDSTCGASSLYSILRYFSIHPKSEKAVVKAMRFNPRKGSDPVHIRQGAGVYGLKWNEYRGMSFHQLIRELDQNHPVMLTLQAYGMGHWVVAIGYDSEVVYFEDPGLRGSRKYLSYVDLDAR
jgi:predicted double-glycine peptidase